MRYFVKALMYTYATVTEKELCLLTIILRILYANTEYIPNCSQVNCPPGIIIFLGLYTSPSNKAWV